MSDERDVLALRAHFELAGQGHVFHFLDDLTPAAADHLVAQARALDLDEVARLALRAGDERAVDVTPPGSELVALDDDDADSRRAAARERGIAMLRRGEVAVVIAAGGQGTRLGFAHPKGLFPCGPLSGKTLFTWLAAKVLHWSRRMERTIPVVVMVSEATADETRAAFEENAWYGLDPAAVHMPCQGALTPLDDAGHLLLETRDRIAMSPNGHGGVYRALAADGLLDRLRGGGVTTFSYVQVDNPLILPVDPVFLGLHAAAGSQISSKGVAKRGPGEKVGVFARKSGRPAVVEYSELSEEQAHETDAAGRLRFGVGSIAAHVLDAAFIAEIAARRLPVHRARKKVPFIDDAGRTVRPDAPNATKFETFLFDAIPLAERALVVETRREDEFSPIKNAEGADSPATSRADVLALHQAWHERAGVELPRSTEAEGGVEVDPLEAPDEDAFRRLHGGQL